MKNNFSVYVLSLTFFAFFSLFMSPKVIGQNWKQGYEPLRYTPNFERMQQQLNTANRNYESGANTVRQAISNLNELSFRNKANQLSIGFHKAYINREMQKWYKLDFSIPNNVTFVINNVNKYMYDEDYILEQRIEDKLFDLYDKLNCETTGSGQERCKEISAAFDFLENCTLKELPTIPAKFNFMLR